MANLVEQASDAVDDCGHPFVDRHRPPTGNINTEAQSQDDTQRGIQQHQLENQRGLVVFHVLCFSTLRELGT